MAPLPEYQQGAHPTATPPENPSGYTQDGDSVVITGMSGAFPASFHVKDLSNVLYNKINPINDKNPRWVYEHPELPKHLGKVPELRTFDAQFFKVHFRLCHNMDVMSRKVLEHVYQAIFDAGVALDELAGRKIGVFIGVCFSETEKSSFYVANLKNGFGIVGCNRSMFANRISYWLNLKGPSMSVDVACASSMVALEMAYDSMTRGECEAAIVGGTYLCIHPQISVHCGRFMQLCMDGKTKTFDKNADGCVRSDGINVLLLEKAKNAKRVYANVCHVKSKFGPKLGEMGQHLYGPFRDEQKLAGFWKEFYEEAGVSPGDVEYVEAFGTAVPEADKNELVAIETVFCQDRLAPLYVGSVTSNIGYSEAASGINSVIKVLLGYHTGKMAANLHCATPRDDIPSLRDGRMRVVTEHTPFGSSYVAVNNFSITGVNAHLLLHGYNKPKDLSRYHCEIPRLVAVSGRQESGAQLILDDLTSRPVDPEEIGLIHNFYRKNISGHVGRGYVILDTNAEGAAVSLKQDVAYFDSAVRPLWFVYSGMGSQWAGMGAQLMHLPVFAAAIERCRIALEPKGIDIVHIITSPEKEIFDNILHSFVGIAAVQIGLTDVLRELGLVPDKIIGHSVGELGCAYADGCFTAEEMILAAYSRGLVSVQTPFIHGSMAAIGVGYEQILPQLPPELQVACHNSVDSSTISGPSELMQEFVAKLTAQGIFAKEVPCSNIAYHSRYIQEAGPGLLKYLREVIKTPKPRSDRWLSTSVPQDRWEEEEAKYSSAEYHTNNLLNPVLFEETSSLVPANAVLIEVAPHGLLQAILTRSLPESCVNVPLTRRGHKNNAIFLLEAIGKLYLQGYATNLTTLYPKIEYPVSTGTPFLSHLVEWIHDEKWFLPLYLAGRKMTAAATKYAMCLHDDEYSYLKGNLHCKDVLYPLSGALIYVWDTLMMSMDASRRQYPVLYRDVQLHSQPTIHEDRLLRLTVQLNRGNGYFEVMNESTKMVSGYVQCAPEESPAKSEAASSLEPDVTGAKKMTLDSDAVYKLFDERGYYYSGEFKSIQGVNEDMTEATISWNGNFVSLLESMIQLNALRKKHDGLAQVWFIRSLHIDVEKKNAAVIGSCLSATVAEVDGITRCGGVTFQGMEFNYLPQVIEEPALKSLKFVPFFQTNTTKVKESLSVFSQIVADNISRDMINVVEIQETDAPNLQNEIHGLMKEATGFLLNYSLVKLEDIAQNEGKLRLAHLVVVRNLSTSDNMTSLLFGVLKRDVFVLSHEATAPIRLPQALCRAVASTNVPDGRLVLCRWRPATAPAVSTVSILEHEDLDLLHSSRKALRPDDQLNVLCRYPPPFGLKQLVLKWRREPERNKIHVGMINHKISKDQDLVNLPKFDLAFNILNHGAWGNDHIVDYEPFCLNIDHNVRLRSSRAGDLDSLYWEEVPQNDLGYGDVAVTVHYAGLNVRDAKKATGAVSIKMQDEIDYGYGMDFSGVTVSGSRVMGVVRGGAASSRVSAQSALLWPVPAHWTLEDAATVPLPYAHAFYCLVSVHFSGSRVMGVVRSGAASSRVSAQSALLWPVPAHWTLEDAATVPLPYAHAFYCLGIKAELLPGKRVLVTGGAGALGMAVISIAMAHGCEVFVLVRDMKKKRFLRKVFPDLPDAHIIGDSRDVSFADEVLKVTKGEGCDYVICTVESRLKNMVLKCCAKFGIILDVSLVSFKENFDFEMGNLSDGKTYVPLDFSSLFATMNTYEMKLIQAMLSEGIARGYVRPLCRVTYEARDAARALRLLAASRQRGRAVLRLRGEPLLQVHRLVVSPVSCHIVVAAADDVLTSHLVQKLIARGVANILLCRPYQNQNEDDLYMQFKIKCWRELGICITISEEYLNSQNRFTALIEKGNSLGVVEAVHVLTSGKIDQQKKMELEALVDNLDTATRTLCSSIKYFSVLSELCPLGQDVCISRLIDKLPATMLYLPKIIKVAGDDGNGLSAASAVEAMERAMRSPDAVLLASALHPRNISFLDYFTMSTGITVSESTPDCCALKELGLELDQAKNLTRFISNYTDVELSSEDIMNLSISTIIEMEKCSVASDTEDGLRQLFSYVDPDELQSSVDMVVMSTASVNADVRQEEFNFEETYLVLVPGLEGHYSKFKSLCERLKLPAVVLQPGFDYPDETVAETADRLVKVLLKKIQPKQRFYLLGYSFGVLVALEMASILEQQGLVGLVYCVDASPDTFPAALESLLGPPSGWQDAIIHHMYTLMTGKSPEEVLSRKLKHLSSWREKVEECVASLRGHVPHSSHYARDVISAAYGRIEQARRYSGSALLARPLGSRLVVLRSRRQHAAAAAAPHDLGLSRYSRRAPIVYTLREGHARALTDLRVPNLINRHLDHDIHAAYLNKNLCERYLLSGSTFVAECEDLPDVY